MDGQPKKLNIILLIIKAVGSIVNKLKLKCHSKCCESDCVLNEEQKILKKNSLTANV